MVHFPAINSSHFSTKSFVPVCIGLSIVAGVALFIFKRWSSVTVPPTVSTKDQIYNDADFLKLSYTNRTVRQESPSVDKKMMNIWLKQQNCRHEWSWTHVNMSLENFLERANNYRILIDGKEYTHEAFTDYYPQLEINRHHTIHLALPENQTLACPCKQQPTEPIRKRNDSKFSPSPYKMLDSLEILNLPTEDTPTPFVKCINPSTTHQVRASNFRELIERMGIELGMMVHRKNEYL